MRKKYIVPFLFAVVLLIFSEYTFLQEMFGSHDILILILTSIGVIGSIVYIVSLIKKYS